MGKFPAFGTRRMGNRGQEVYMIQQMLNVSFQEARVAYDGVFGQKTYDTLKEFQGLCGLTQDGICGANTWTRLCPQLPTQRYWNYTLVVKEVQEGLQNAHWYSGAIDGSYGDGTRNGVKLFQKHWGLTQDGIWGHDCWYQVAYMELT